MKRAFKPWHVGAGRYAPGWSGGGRKGNKYKPSNSFPLTPKRRARNVKLVQAHKIGTFTRSPWVGYIKNPPAINHVGTGRNPQSQPTLLLDRKLARSIRQERRVRSRKHV